MTQEELGVVNAGVEKMLAEKTADIQAKFDTAVAVNKSEFDKEIAAQKAEKDTLTKSIDDLEKVVFIQGEALKNHKAAPENVEQKNAEFVQGQIKALFDGTETVTNKSKVTIKAYADDAIAVNTHNGFAGAIANIGNYFAQMIPGVFRKPVAKSTILSEVTIVPLNADRLVAMSQTETVNIAITPECTIKPVSNVIWDSIDVSAEAMATTFKTSSKLRRYFPTFVNIFIETLYDYFDKKIPELVISQIQLFAIPFTAVPAQQTKTNPNRWDAIVAMIASNIKLGYIPTSVRISPVAWEAMMTQAAADGHYLLQNGGSINLLNSTINFADLSVKIMVDLSFGDDQVMVGDLSNVYLGLDSNVDYSEFYNDQDGVHNIMTHRLERFVACLIPRAVRSGIYFDTFTNVIAAITKP